MSIKNWPGGVINKTPVTPAGPYADGAAPGVWTLEQATNYIKQGIWPLAGNYPTDPYFKYVTMLLPGNGTNGAQNNTFLDSSTNAFTITRNGNTTQGSFSPYGSLWSNYFDGDADYLTLGANSAFAFGAGDFTVECWINTTTKTADTYYRRVYMTDGPTGNAGGNFQIAIAPTTGYVNLWDSVLDLLGTTDVCDGSWHHIAAVRSGTTLRLFVDGVQQASTTYSTSVAPNSGSPRPYIGTYNGGEGDFGGHISNLRVVKGTALYTSAFTPSTTPLTAVSGTSLLTCQSNRFIDNSANNFTITPSGSPQVTNFAPFNPTAAYSTATNGGSGYFDGSGDYLFAGSNSAFSLGTGDFTFQAWVYPLAWTSPVAAIFDTGSGVVGGRFSVVVYNGGTVKIDNSTNLLTSSTSLRLNEWTLITVIRSGGAMTLYFNGVSVASGSIGTNFTETQSYIGRTVDGYYLQGYISDLRLVKGSALTNAVPTAPLSNVTNTSLLLNFTNAAIFDNAMMNDLETVGNAQISTSVKKYGTGSLAFDGTGDGVVSKGAPLLTLGGDFTVEFWMYRTSSDVEYPIDLYMIPPTDTQAVSMYINNSGAGSYNAVFNGGTKFTGASGSIPANQWVHVAIVRQSGVHKVYIDGVANASTYTSSTVYSNCQVGVGCNITGGYSYTGYIDDLRITNGVARYTANFTPPTAAFPTN